MWFDQFVDDDNDDFSMIYVGDIYRFFYPT